MHSRNHHDEVTGDATGWAAFLAGALIGAGIALLCAPQPGRELRGRLREYTNRTTDDLLDKGQEAWDTAVERGREYYDKGEEAIRHGRQSAREFTKQGQEAVKEVGRSATEYAKQAQDVAREPGRSAL